MANDVAIRVEGLGKRYRLGERSAPYRTLRETIMGLGRRRSHEETIWALKGVDLEVRRGEVLGVIGRNGAGKTTLLKILSRITEPTTGRVELRGRVGSLLEVGTGFHPELTGRENIYLNGAILGMRKVEIQRKFDEIVAFAEVERFLDTPVKHYSSGMYVRLAFAVAAHLEPEILLVDEVLAVGDAAFQKKCLGKMEDLGESGLTILFVSHSISAVGRLCTEALLLDAGQVVRLGPVHEVTNQYLLSDVNTRGAREWTDVLSAPQDEVVRLRAVRVRNARGEIADHVDIRDAVQVEVEFEVVRAGHVLVPNIHLFDERGECVFISHDSDSTWFRSPRPTGMYRSCARIPGNLLAEGLFVVSAAVSTHNPLRIHFFERDAVAFQVVDPGDGTTARGDYLGPMPGVVRPVLEWTTDTWQT